jgi:RNA polymerase sigma-70 factor (ECF subfamily)
VLGWIMNQARSRAIDRLRFDQRKKRVDPRADEEPSPHSGHGNTMDALESKQQGEVLRRAVAALSTVERQAIETAFFSELTYAETAVRLNQPLGTVKTRIRSALHKLRQALDDEGAPK